MFMNAEAVETTRSGKPPVTALALVSTSVRSKKAPEFIRNTFGPATDGPVWIQSLGNDRDGDEQPKHIVTRDTAHCQVG
jgi:hypothetical protein